LISGAIDPELEQIEFLRTQGVTLPVTATQLDANRKIAAIVAGSFDKKRGGWLGNWARLIVLLLMIVALAKCSGG
jgi:hypothetical protein